MKGMLNHRRPPSRYPRTEAEGRAAMALCQYACAAPTQGHSSVHHPTAIFHSHAGQWQGQADMNGSLAGQPSDDKANPDAA